MAESPNVNPTPKARFIGYKPFVDAHRELISKPELQRAIDYALLERLNELAAATVDGSSAAARFYMLQGAVEFATCMKRLSEQSVIPRAVRSEREMPHDL